MLSQHQEQLQAVCEAILTHGVIEALSAEPELQALATATRGLLGASIEQGAALSTLLSQKW
jgi:hypothetical protein